MTPRERLFALEQFGIKLGLDHITCLVDALGHPERAYPVVHIAGTNGKGSVAAMVERGLRAAGYRTGRYTSPHLSAIEERIAVDGQPLPAAEFDDLAAAALALVDRLIGEQRLSLLPTFFEVTTAMAFEAFRRAGVTAAVIEVGLGGRFDATNVVAPLVTAITSIAFDHERHLGHTLAAIAAEKAGIIKRGVPVIVGALPPDAHAVVVEAARTADAPLTVARPAAEGTAIALALHGRHQHQNAAVAVETLRACGRAGLGVARPHLEAALTEVRWPARLEWLRLAPPHQGDVLLDAAHNPAGAAALADYLVHGVGPLPMVCSIMRDKDVTALIRALAPGAAAFVATTAATPRALPGHDLAAQIAAALPSVPVTVAATPEEAVARALASAPRAAAAGSIYMVGPLRAALIARGAAPVRYPSTSGPFFLT